jgi:hypothetical protein
MRQPEQHAGQLGSTCADQPGQSQGSDGKSHEGREHPSAMPQGPIEQANVAEPEALEQSVE